MSEFRFAEAQWAHALWAVAFFVALLFWLERRGSGAIDRMVAAKLQSRLVRRPTRWRRRLRIVLLGLSAVFLVVALMRPQFGIRHVVAQRVGAEIMVALDVSNSMLAEDVAPNRLERAKAEIVDLLGYLVGDQVGLIAFAGRATVLAPLTPDFSFLRLVLDGAGPQSVTRGGTRLEEPIRKAVRGFGPAGDAARAILLITDGEDHDSFPLDAAAEAAEAGIVIIAIGFGDEAGSEIHITDPRSGVREALRDSDGRPVRSRLDGDLLRDIALATGGAYVPAGTGVLDLESIYQQHIERLMAGRLDPRGKTVRDEGYQWAVLLALVFLVSSAAVSAGATSIATAALLLALVFEWTAPPVAGAQDAPPAGETAEQEASEIAPPEGEDTLPDGEEPPQPETPRDVYNRGVAALEMGDTEEATRWFERSRREARGDGELRFRAAYDLGIATALRAEQLEAESSDEALRTLYTAADWFRDAIQTRPEDDDSRANLEVALRRALLLADRLAQQDEKGVDAGLEALLALQRATTAEIAQLLERASTQPDAFSEDRLRREFRERAKGQRTLLSDADRLAEQIDSERQAIDLKPEAERAPEQQMRAVQLENVLHYLHRARERMGQARRQLRQRQGERAYRRAAAALGELKRGVDQLRDPVQLLDVLVRDATQVATDTATLALSHRDLSGLVDKPRAPAWLSDESLSEDQQALTERTQELDMRLLAGLEGEAASAEEAEQIDAVRSAEPLVSSAATKFAQAASELAAGSLDAALPLQGEGIVALADARERFLDLRGLIEATYADEQRMVGFLGVANEAPAAARGEYLPGLRELRARNIARAERLAEKLQREAIAHEFPQPGPDGSLPDPETLEIQKQRFELAGQLLTLALGGMDDVSRALAASGSVNVDYSAAREPSAEAVSHLESLRRLFFSITEQLQDVLREQTDITDATRDAAVLMDEDSESAESRLGPLPPRQQSLAERTGEIANALEDQSNQSGGVLEEEHDGWETSRLLREAGEHTLLAQIEMEQAASQLAKRPPEFESTQERQALAITELERALELLVPPEEREQEDDSESSEGDSSDSGEAQEEPSDAPSPAADPAQLLQSVRDREAERRRERDSRGAAGYETVEKDW